MDGAKTQFCVTWCKNTGAWSVKFCVKVGWRNADGKNPAMADAEPKTPAVQEGKNVQNEKAVDLVHRT